MLDADPSLRWQVERDLLHASPETWQSTRARVSTEGHGAALLARQDADGQWDGGAYFPAGYFGSPEAEKPGQPRTATTQSLKDHCRTSMKTASSPRPVPSTRDLLPPTETLYCCSDCFIRCRGRDSVTQVLRDVCAKGDAPFLGNTDRHLVEASKVFTNGRVVGHRVHGNSLSFGRSPLNASP